MKRISNTIIILAVYVDNLVIASNDKLAVQNLKQALQTKSKVNDSGKLKFIVGIEVIRDRKNKKISFTQRQYVRDILKRFNMTNCKPASTPLIPGIKLGKTGIISNSDVVKLEDAPTNAPYLEAIRSLIYAMIATRPDICFAVGYLSRYMSSPKESHWNWRRLLPNFGTNRTFLKMRPEPKLMSPSPTASSVDPPATPISRGFFKGSYRENKARFSVQPESRIQLFWHMFFLARRILDSLA